MRLTTRLSGDAGSIPLALLASIVAGGLAVVLVSTVLQAERSVRFDRGFTNAVHSADNGVQEAYYQISSGALTLAVGDTSPVQTTTVNGTSSNWEVERISQRQYEVRSTGTVEGVPRTVVAGIEQEALFYPGAFADQLVNVNGASSLVDSYESRTTSCPATPEPSTCWGTDDDFGTGNGALGTNGDFTFQGTERVRRALLYDWEANPGSGVTLENPGGSRCNEASRRLCTPEVLRFKDEKLEYGSDDRVRFIHERLAQCDDESNREQGALKLGYRGSNRHATELRPQSEVAADSPAGTDPSHPTWNNFYCADTLEIYGDVTFPDATPETPLVVFVRDAVAIRNNLKVNCPDCASPGGGDGYWKNKRPKAASVQIYVASERDASGADVSIGSGTTFAGVLYAPRANCGGTSGGAGVDIYGSVICRRLDNVGKWQFHFDDALADLGRDTYTVGNWREEPATRITP